jgi:hypothetical protein
MGKKTPNVTAGEAIAALEEHLQIGMLWKMKAITLLQMVGQDGIDQKKLAEQCKTHAETGLDV